MDDFVPFVPAWSKTWSAEKAEKELIGFKFLGSGWYLTKTDTMLVTPYGSSGVLFTFHVWNTPSIGTLEDGNPSEAFNWIINAPTRLDERDDGEAWTSKGP